VDRSARHGRADCYLYTRPWMHDTDFNPAQHPHLTASMTRAIDAAIDMYNETIQQVAQ